MNRSLICVHCGTVVGVETGTEPVGGAGRPLVAHLVSSHHEVVVFDPPRWAVLLEHFRVIPVHHPSSPRVVQA